MESSISNEMSVCESWNWNCSPRECAIEARKLGWSAQKVESAMRNFGFKQKDISAVVREVASLGSLQ